jgi:hypothetical protein
MRLFSFYPQACDVGETHSLVPPTTAPYIFLPPAVLVMQHQGAGEVAALPRVSKSSTNTARNVMNNIRIDLHLDTFFNEKNLSSYIYQTRYVWIDSALYKFLRPDANRNLQRNSVSGICSRI